MSEICGFSHKCVLCSDVCVKPSRLLLKEFLILCCVFLSTCLPSPMHTHSHILTHFSVILAQNDPSFDCSERKKNPCLPGTVGMKNSLSFHEQHRRPNSSGGRLAGCSLQPFSLCVYVLFCFYQSESRAPSQ